MVSGCFGFRSARVCTKASRIVAFRRAPSPLNEVRFVKSLRRQGDEDLAGMRVGTLQMMQHGAALLCSESCMSQSSCVDPS